MFGTLVDADVAGIGLAGKLCGVMRTRFPRDIVMAELLELRVMLLMDERDGLHKQLRMSPEK